MVASSSQLTKRDRYLTEGRVAVVVHSVEPPFAHLKVMGSGDEPYEVWFRANCWACSCPAQKVDCVHVLAAMMISPLRPVQGGSTGLGTSSELDELLGVGAPVDTAFEDWPDTFYDDKELP
jgi:hypothetical protein